MRWRTLRLQCGGRHEISEGVLTSYFEFCNSGVPEIEGRQLLVGRQTSVDDSLSASSVSVFHLLEGS